MSSDAVPPHERIEPLGIGELVQRRHPALVALVFVFAVFLAAAPFLFRYEQSPYPEALTLYERACAAVAQDDLRTLQGLVSARTISEGGLATVFLASRLTCVDRRRARATLQRLDDAAGARAYLLTVHPDDGSRPVRFRVVTEGEVLRWWPEARP